MLNLLFALLAGACGGVVVKLLSRNDLERIMSELTDLQAKVATVLTVEASAAVLIAGLKASLDAAIASNDPAALAKLSADLGASSDALAAAVAANTPSATAP